MQGINIITPGRSITRVYPGLLVLAMLLPVFLSILGGCATSPMEPVPAAHEPAPEKGPPLEISSQEPPPQEPVKTPTVARLTDGREGFLITEIPRVDEASQRDFDRAVTMLKAQDYDEAIVLLERVIGRSPGVTAPYIDLAIAYGHTGRSEQAEENLKTALHMFPGHPVACNEFGLLYRRTGRFAEARAIYEMAIARFPEYYPARRNLGILCDLYLGDPACALEQYEVYSDANPYDEQVKLWVADLRARLGRDQGER